MIVRITKVDALSKAGPAADWLQFVRSSGTATGASLPIGYELEGELLALLRPGQPAVALRLSRNGVLALGLFTSTEVQQILFSAAFLLHWPFCRVVRAESNRRLRHNSVTDFRK